MGQLFSRINQIVKTDDPEKLLDLAIEDMQNKYEKLYAAIISMMAAQKITEKKYDYAPNEVEATACQTTLDNLKHNLAQLEKKISEAKIKKAMLKARITAQVQLGSMVRGMNTSSAMNAFERMEEKVLMQESRHQSVAELAGNDLETQFSQLESSNVDDELAALKAQMSLPRDRTNQPQLPQQDTNSQPQEPVDAELDALRKQLDQM